MADIKTNIPKTAIRTESNDWCLRFTVALCMLTAIASFGIINYLQFDEIWNLKVRVQQLEKSCMFVKVRSITQTCPCNILQYFTAVKMMIFR